MARLRIGIPPVGYYATTPGGLPLNSGLREDQTVEEMLAGPEWLGHGLECIYNRVLHGLDAGGG
jgi:hypothetical protein